jgi:hypothetical protein
MDQLREITTTWKDSVVDSRFNGVNSVENVEFAVIPTTKPSQDDMKWADFSAKVLL